jgi:U3 small nucleolar RNA-associated protein 10
MFKNPQSLKVRLVTIEVIQAVAEVLREDLLPLLPEAIPFIAELTEDEDPEVEKKTQNVFRELEKILGEPLDKFLYLYKLYAIK